MKDYQGLCRIMQNYAGLSRIMKDFEGLRTVQDYERLSHLKDYSFEDCSFYESLINEVFDRGGPKTPLLSS